MSAFIISMQGLIAERDSAFVARLASELNLDLAELTSKYAEVTATAFKIPKKNAPRGELKPGSAQCKGTTAKGIPCKFSALPGGECCKRHSRETAPKEVKEPKEKKEKPVKVVPKHTHELDGEDHPDCELCESHGTAPFRLPALEEEESDEESDEEPTGEPTGEPSDLAGESDFDEE